MLHCILNTVIRHIHGRRGTPAIKAALYPVRIVGGTSRGRRGPRALRATPRRRFGFMIGYGSKFVDAIRLQELRLDHY